MLGSALVKNLEEKAMIVQGSRDIAKLKSQTKEIKFDGIVWAQGVNQSSGLMEFDREIFEKIMYSNVGFILDSAKLLMESNSLSPSCQMVIVGSIWGKFSRPSKLYYSISKAAISGLVQSLAIELGTLNIFVNSISPGPIDSPMTRTNLSEVQISSIESETPILRLVKKDEVCALISEFALGKFQGITGQDIVIDGGWGISKLV